MALSDLYPGIRQGTPYTSRWQSFLDDLRQQGVHVDPRQSGGYNPRNIRGTNTPSLHASDRAYDVNWGANPEGSVQDEADIARQHLERDMGGSTAPITRIHPMIARETAARHGARWGGDFRTRSPDPQHFEFPGAMPGGMPGRSLVAHAGMTPPTAAPATTGATPMATASGSGLSPSFLSWLIPQAQAATSGAFAPRQPVGDPFAGDWSLGGAMPGDTPAPPAPAMPAAPFGASPGPRTRSGVPYGSALPPTGAARSGGLRPPVAAAPMGAPQFPGQPGIGSDEVASPPAQLPQTPSALDLDWQPPGSETVPAFPEGTVTPTVPPPEGPGYFERLMGNPAFLAGLSILGTAPGGNWGPNAAQTLQSASKNQREQRQRTVMDRVWAEAFPNGQANTQHPLLQGQSPQVAAMLHALGPETALPLLARARMQGDKWELKDVGGVAYLHNERTNQLMQVPGSQGGKPPGGFRWAEGQQGQQLEPIPGGPGEQIASDIAGRVAMIRTVRPQLPAVREFFTRRWSPGEMARNTVGGSIVAPEYDRSARVVRASIEAALRAMTGQAAPESEVRNYMSLYMPSVTDPKETAKQKLDLLETFLNNMEDAVTRGRRPAGDSPAQQQQRVRTYNPQTGDLE